MYDYGLWHSFGSGFFERIIQRAYSDLIEPGDTAMDVGANHAIHTVPMAECVGPSGRLIAYEAIPALAETVEKLTAHLSQVEVVNVAVAAETGTATFKWAKAGDGYSGLRERGMPEAAQASIVDIIVRTSTIDDSVQTLRHGPLEDLRFIKMDIEGGEFHALSGARDTIQRFKPFIVLENGRENAAQLYGYTREAWFQLFAELNYEVYDLFGRPFGIGNWSDGKVPCYFIGVARGSTDERYVQENFPRQISGMEATATVRVPRPRMPVPAKRRLHPLRFFRALWLKP